MSLGPAVTPSPVQAMSKGIGAPMRCISRLARLAIALVLGITIALLGNSCTIAARDVGASTIACAEREVLVLVETHGAFPSAAESAALIEARAVCANEHVRDATRPYDRLVTKLRMSLAQDGED